MVLTMGVDIQADRIEAEIVGWGIGEESWNIDYRVLHGDTSQPEVWDELSDLIDYEYTHENGNILHIVATCIDSGYNTQIVYDFVKKNAHRRVYAVKGVAGAGRPIVTSPSQGKAGKKKRKVDLYTVGVDDAKTLLSARLKIRDEGAGYCHFPIERDEEYFLQITAEKVVTKYRRGFAYREWVKTRPRNEATDCRIYSHAGLKILNPNWQAIAKTFEPVVEKKPEVPDSFTQAHIKNKRRPPRKRGFVQRY